MTATAQATHCKHGHPWNEQNTYHSPQGTRQCRKCRSINQARYHREAATGPRLLPPAPLVALQGDRTDGVFAEVLGVTRRTVLRWRAGGGRIPRTRAERHAAALGRAVADIWPEASA